jgi:hypothetical protein
VCCLKFALVPTMTELPWEAVHRQDQLERFLMKREHSQHIQVQYHIRNSGRSYYNLGSCIRCTKEVWTQNYALEDKTEFAEAIFLNGQDILFALKKNAIHQHSKPENPSMESNPHRFGLPTDNSHRHRRQQEVVPQLHIEDSKSKVWATTLSKTYPRWQKDHL